MTVHFWGWDDLFHWKCLHLATEDRYTRSLHFYHNLDRQGWNISENTNALYSSPGIHSSQIIAEQSLKQLNICRLLTHGHNVHLSKQVHQLHKFACNPNPLHIRLFSQLSSLTTKCKWAPAPDVSFQTQLKNVTGRQNADVCTQYWNAKV